MKNKIFLWLLFSIVFVPIDVLAKDNTKKMYINIDVLEDGSIKVEELATLSGEYNGRTRNIEFKNLEVKDFSKTVEDFKGSSIYNGTSIENIEVCDAPLDFSKNDFGKCEKKYNRVEYASNGMSGVYQQTDKVNGIDLKIYNPSSRKKAFYLSYIIRDVVVVHNDVAELAWNILGSSYQEDIKELKVWVNLPEKDKDLRVWLKGNKNTLNGEIKKENNKTAYIYYNFLGAYNPITVRMMFAKNITPLATKQSMINGKDNILKVEKEASEEANRIRDKIKNQNKTVILVTIFWYIVSVITLIYLIFSIRKNKKVDFFHDYYRDIPANYGPEILEYLLKKNITDKALASSLLNIIDKKVLKIEEIKDKKKDYLLILADSNNKNLTENENRLCHLFIEKIGNGKEVSLNKIKNFGNTTKNAKLLLDQYNIWKTNAKVEGREQNFFSGVHRSQSIAFIVGFLSIVLVYFNIYFDTRFIPGYLAVVLGILEGVYAMSYSFRTEKGALEYEKWQAFKRFLKDFGTLDEKELPEIKLWGKYLVYATILGCADEVEKAMKIKMDAMNIEEGNTLYWDYYYTNRLMRAGFYTSISSSVTTAVSSSRSSIVASSSSSSAGFGGGSSFGGGSFGGGGGGGRF